MVEAFIQWIDDLSKVIPLPLFVIFGSILEEVIAPIPSPLVMSSAGTIIHARGYSTLYTMFIAIIGAASKTVSSLVLYVLGDKAEDVLINRFGKVLKISHEDTEALGRKFNNTRRDDVLLFILRAVPVFPNAPVSILCGIIQLNLKTYITATFAGTVVKNLIYIYAGIISLNYLEQFKDTYPRIENLGYLLLFAIFAYGIFKHQSIRDTVKKVIDKYNSFLKK
ncbi:MAG: DedA family protein [Patescibacteria group bacterium]